MSDLQELSHLPGMLPPKQLTEEHKSQDEDPNFPNPHRPADNQRFYRRHQAHVRKEPEPDLHGDLSHFQFPARPQPDEFDPDKIKEQLLALTKDSLRCQQFENEQPRSLRFFKRNNMLPANLTCVPYTISSEEWCLSSNSSKSSQCWDDVPGEQLAARRTSVISVYSMVYAMAKVVFTIFVNYGVELDDSPTGLKFHIERAEVEVTSDSLATLIKTIEDLYYVLYARLAIEIGNVLLCSSFNLDIRRMSGKETFLLPEPSHMYTILRACKDVLDAPEVCKVLDKEIIKQHQEDFVRRAIAKLEEIGYIPNDLLGYRRYILRLVSEDDSPWCQTWCGLHPIYQMAPGEILAIMSEKYLCVTPREKPGNDTATENLPFVDRELVDPDEWEHEIILDNRQATWAKLEGKSVGEMRREDERRPLMAYVKERKCICFAFCSCARDCTNDVERLCPCAERMMRVLLAEQSTEPGEQTFGERCADLADVVFEGLATVYREAHDFEMAMEIKFALDLFEREILNQRRAAEKAKEE